MAAFTHGWFLRATERQVAHPFADSRAQTGIFPNCRRVISSGKQRLDPGGDTREFISFFLMSVIFQPGEAGGRVGIIEQSASERLAPSALPCHFSFYSPLPQPQPLTHPPPTHTKLPALSSSSHTRDLALTRRRRAVSPAGDRWRPRSAAHCKLSFNQA